MCFISVFPVGPKLEGNLSFIEKVHCNFSGLHSLRIWSSFRIANLSGAHCRAGHKVLTADKLGVTFFSVAVTDADKRAVSGLTTFSG